MKKSTILLIAAAVICLGLSFVSAKGSVTRTIHAISNIGDVTYSEESKEKLDLAVTYYNALDTNLDLKDKITNIDEFNTAKIEYTRLAIKAAKVADARKTAEGYSSADVQKFVAEARTIADTYLTEEQYSLVENYADLKALEADYSANGGANDSSDGEEASVPMC